MVQSCLTLGDFLACSPPESSVYGIFQARILEWVAISFSRGCSQPRDGTPISCIGRWILYHWAIGDFPKSPHFYRLVWVFTRPLELQIPFSSWADTSTINRLMKVTSLSGQGRGPLLSFSLFGLPEFVFCWRLSREENVFSLLSEGSKRTLQLRPKSKLEHYHCVLHWS